MTELRFYNTLGRQLQAFRPIHDGEVRLYTCGPTVYNNAHIGNLRTFVFEDLLRRSLSFLGYRVQQVMNITDVDDKTIAEAGKKSLLLDDYTAPYIESFFADLDTLHVERAEHYPRATEHIPEMIELIEELMKKGFAYAAEDGSVFFRIAADDDYGRLSGFDLDQVRSGERVASDEYEKEDVRDFVLWKAAKEGEPFWDSPWGRGRPGWHVECSAMSSRYLGETFDVHCGGVDNIFPHHENEIAQSESASGKPFANYWLHAEHLIVDGQKMSKSLGNFYTLEELLEKGESARAIRYLFLSVHYRQTLNFTFEGLKGAESALARLDEMQFRLEHSKEVDRPSVLTESLEKLNTKFRAALADDLNSAGALGALFTFVKEVNVAIEAGPLGRGDRESVRVALAEVDRVFGVLDQEDWQDKGSGQDADSDALRIEALISERRAARDNRDFATADRIRDELLAEDIVLEDTPDGTRWKRR